MAATGGTPAQQQLKISASVTDGNSVERLAERLLGQYGEEAAAIALDRADALYDLGNIAGSRAWIRVLETIEERQRQHSNGNTPSHGARK